MRSDASPANGHSVEDFPPAEPSRLTYRIDEAAGILGVSRATIYRLVRLGEIRLLRILGRSLIEARELTAFLDRSRNRER